MAAAKEKAQAAHVLHGAGMPVPLVADLLQASEKSVYGWLKLRVAGDVRAASIATDLDQRLAVVEGRDETFVALARALAGKLDQLIASDKGVDAATIPPLTKEYTSLVQRILGPSSDDKQWIIGVFAPVGHAPDFES